VVIVNQAFARKFFPGQNAVGQHMRSGLGHGDTPPMREIVGVVGNVKRASLTEPDKPEYYIPYEQAPVAPAAVALRVAGDPNNYAKQVRAEVAKLDSSLPTYRLQSYQDDLARITAQQRFQTLLLTAFAAIALLLAALGLYAVLSYMVAQRTTEFGLRIALGAPRSHVLQLMLSRGLTLTCVGLAVGLACSALLTHFVAGLLYNVKALDAVTFASMALVLLLVSTVACLIPAWQAAMLDPNDTLRKQ
jgi:ABC-type antimicrobial peptide transport system permease subunit